MELLLDTVPPSDRPIRLLAVSAKCECCRHSAVQIFGATRVSASKNRLLWGDNRAPAGASVRLERFPDMQGMA